MTETRRFQDELSWIALYPVECQAVGGKWYVYGPEWACKKLRDHYEQNHPEIEVEDSPAPSGQGHYLILPNPRWDETPEDQKTVTAFWRKKDEDA